MLDAGYLHDLNRVLASLEDRIELSASERSAYFQPASTAPTAQADDQRSFVRRPLRVRAVMDLAQSLPAIERQRAFHCVYVRDISRTGISFLCADEMFPGEECRLWLPQRNLDVSAVRCRRQSPRCYVIGARFRGTA